MYKKSQVIFDEGATPYGVYCINYGKVRLVKTDKNAREHTVRLASDGDIIGLKAILANETYSASAIAMEDSKVCFLPKEIFGDIITANPMVAQDIIKQLSGALSSAEEKMAHLAMKPVRERLAETLLMLKEKFQTHIGEHFEISISRDELASIVGTSKETVIRFLSEFKDENLLDTKGSKIVIINTKKLNEISSMYD